ncbi:MAG: hypothetical protein ABIO82_04465 [Ginsengibacter sp.]
MEKNKNFKDDLQDSQKDKDSMKEDNVVIDLPDVEDIPGQENFTPLALGELADTTASSADEEGDLLFDDTIAESIADNPDSNVSREERETLERTVSDLPTEDDQALRMAALDDTDEDGVPLNESSFKNNLTGTGLDVPGAENDDADERIGEEDEENNEYSLGGDNHD